MEEEWRDIPGWEDRYMVSNTGRVYSKITKKIRKTCYSNCGHEVIILSKNGKNFGTFVHRLVAMAFIPNPYNFPIVNHKDENPKNNSVENLEWCTHRYNQMYSDVTNRVSKQTGTRVYAYNRDGEIVHEFPSIRKAALELGLSNSNISENCKKILLILSGNEIVGNKLPLTVGGYIWSDIILSKSFIEYVFNRSDKNNNLKK